MPPRGTIIRRTGRGELVCDTGVESFFCADNPDRTTRVLEIPHYALLLFALLLSRFTARCMVRSECNGGRCNLDIDFELANSPTEPRL